MERMFKNKKTPEFSFQKTAKKFLSDKENLQRIKHLRTIIDNVAPPQLKSFVSENHSLIFTAFYDVYSSVVAELQQKATASHYKELQNILVVLEKIFVTLPELISAKWQFCCISSILKSLLHPKNIMKVKLRGVRLFVLWFQILNTDAPDACLEIFINLVPIFYPIIKSKICPNMFQKKRLSESNSEESCSNVVIEADNKPIITQNVEKDFEPENSNHYLLRYLLRYMVTEGLKVDWRSDGADRKRIDCYHFLFDKFKEFYLPAIFPKCSDNYTLEKNQTMLISFNELDSYYKEYETYPIAFSEVGVLQEEVVLWLCELTYNSYFIMDENLGRSNSNSSKSLANYLIKFDDDGLQLTENMLNMMRHILFDSIENVNVINQLLQHSFYLPPHQFSRAQFGVLCVYQSWLFTERPPSFMLYAEDSFQHPVVSMSASCDQSVPGKSPIRSLFDRRSIDHQQSTPPQLAHSHMSESPALVPPSSFRVNVTMQRVIFTNVALLFLHTNSPSKDIVLRAIETILRPSINNFSNLEVEHLMNILLDIGFKVLSRFTPQTCDKVSWISKNGCLGQFFQTLNVLLVKSSLTNYISEDLWNMYLAVYSRLNEWNDFINEWVKTVKLLLKMLARYLYGVDPNDLPLERAERRLKTNNDKKSPATQTLERILRTDKQPSPRPVNKPRRVRGQPAQVVPALQIPLEVSVNQNNQIATQAPASPMSYDRDNYLFMAGLHHVNDSDENTANTNTVTNQESAHLSKQNDDTVSNSEELNRVNENEQDSIAYSSHDDNSSYVSAEESSSPNTQAGGSTNKHDYAMSDSDQAHMSSSGCEMSFETNDNSFEFIETKQNHNSDVMLTSSDTHDEEDADDEDEDSSGGGSGVNCSISNANTVSESKSATLTRDTSDIDLNSDVGAVSGNNQEECKTPTKTNSVITFKRNQQHSLLHNFKRQNGDRNSMNIEDNINLFNTTEIRKAVSIDNINTHHISMRGTSIGWSDESVVLLWKRFLGLLGNISLIENKDNLQDVLLLLDKVTITLLDIRRNMGLGASHPPCFVPPIEMISSWLFQILNSDSHDTDIKVICLNTLCKITVRRHDIEPPTNHLTLFYKLVHRIIHTNDTNLLYPLIINLGAHFFSQPLAGSEMLVGDMIRAADVILKTSFSSTNAPKKEILVILSQIIQLLRVSDDFLILDPESHDVKVMSIPSSYKKQAVELVMTCVRREENLGARILALKVITNLCYSDIITNNSKDRAETSIMQLLGVIRWGCCSSQEAEIRLALLACDMIRVLVNCASHIATNMPAHIPSTIIQVLCWTLSSSWSHRRRGQSNAALQKLLVSQIFALLEWCMCVSIDQSSQLVHLVFSTLKCIVDDQSLNDEFSDPLANSKNMFELSPVKDESRAGQTGSNNNTEQLVRVVQLTARMTLCHLLNYLGHYPPPLHTDHKESLTCCVQEYHDMCPPDTIDLNETVFESDKTQVFVVNGSMIVTLLAIHCDPSITLDMQDTTSDVAPGGPPITKTGLGISSISIKEIRVIIRDMCGKYCWDCKFISRPEDLNHQPESPSRVHPLLEANTPPSPPPRRHPPAALLTSASNKTQKPSTTNASSNPPKDNVSKLFDEIGTESPELNLFSSSTTPSSAASKAPVKPNIIESQLSFELIAKKHIIDHNNNERSCFEKNHCTKISYPRLSDKHLRQSILFAHALESSSTDFLSNEYFCRQLLTELGYLSWKRRGSIEVMQKQKLSRELRSLDKNTKVRDTHKVAVLYVGWGQEDKDSILSNSQEDSSAEFCHFVDGLGWPVCLQKHQGFLGGLDNSKAARNGTHAPYYSTSNLEVIFHVSTWMPSVKKDDNSIKFKHLGNDDVMIIWSENYRDYISKITKTQFGEVMIIIYPLRNGLFRIQIEQKQEKIQTKFHGPLYDGAIVGEQELSALVRATAVNAGKAIRDFKPHFLDYYIERATYLERAIKNYKLDQTYEQFGEIIYGSPKESISSPTNSNNNNHANIKLSSPEGGGALSSSISNSPATPDSTVKTIPTPPQKNVDVIDKISPKAENRSQNPPATNLSPQDEKNKTLKPPKINK